MSRIFTDAQLRELEKSLPQQALEAIDAGDTGRLSHLLLQMWSAHTALHFLGVACITRIWGKWHRDHGEETTIAALERIGRKAMAPFIAQWRNGEEKRTIADIIELYKHQAGGRIAPAKQADGEIVFHLTPCGSGGANVLKGFEKKMPQWYRRTEAGTPIFCAGCKALQKAVNDQAGTPVWTTDINGSVPGACRMTFRPQQAQAEGMFTPQELYSMVRPKAEQALEKVSVGKYDVADLVRGQQYDWGPWHDFLMTWTEYTFAICREMGGMDYLRECLQDGYDSAFGFLYNSMEAFPDDESRVIALAQNWHYHQGAFRIEEEDDRFVFILDPCGSGGRMFREEMAKDSFHYNTELAPIEKEAHDITFNRKDFPLYCTHCASGNIDQFKGKPLIFVVDGHAQMRRGMPCRQYLWKKGAPRAVEDRLLAQVGMSGQKHPGGAKP